jgi:TPR repeat protein
MRIDEIIVAARAGCSEAQFLLSFLHEHGYGMPEDDDEARAWLKLAAEAGVLFAQYEWGIVVETGEGGIAANPEEAFKWMKQAADRGLPDAQCHLARYYEFGIGTAPDLEIARGLYEMAATRGSVSAMLYLGLVYAEGLFGEKDLEKSFHWYAKAAAGHAGHAGHAEHAGAIHSLAHCYEKGEGVQADPAKALELYTRAAELGELFACLRLYMSYSFGDSLVAVDQEKAAKYREMADELSSRPWRGRK